MRPSGFCSHSDCWKVDADLRGWCFPLPFSGPETWWGSSGIWELLLWCSSPTVGPWPDSVWDSGSSWVRIHYFWLPDLWVTLTSTSWIKVMNSSRRQNCEVNRLCLGGPMSPFFSPTPFVFPTSWIPSCCNGVPFSTPSLHFALRKDLISLTLKILIFIILNMSPSKWAFIFNNNYFRLKGWISKYRTQGNSQVVGEKYLGNSLPKAALHCYWFSDDLKNFHWTCEKSLTQLYYFLQSCSYGVDMGWEGRWAWTWFWKIRGQCWVLYLFSSWEIPEW